MAEYNKDAQISYLPVLGKVSNSKVSVKTYTIYEAPKTKLYKVLNTTFHILGIATLASWFILLLLLIGITFTMLNSLNTVTVIRNQHPVYLETVNNNGESLYLETDKTVDETVIIKIK
jgi:hypothetical protein